MSPGLSPGEGRCGMRFPLATTALANFLLAAGAASQPASDKITIGDASYSIMVLGERFVAERVSKFEADARRRGIAGQIECSLVIDIPIGTVTGNHSYGGLCILRQGSTRTPVAICNDELVGHFAMSWNPAFTKERLAKFVADQCFGG